MKKVYTNKWAKKLRYQLRSKKRVTVIRTRNPTWRIKEESLAENAKASITTRHTPSNTNAVLSVFHVGPWNPFNKTNHHQCLDYIYMYIYEKKRERERLYGRWHRELVLQETQLVQMIWLPHLISYFPFPSVVEIWKLELHFLRLLWERERGLWRKWLVYGSIASTVRPNLKHILW